MARTVKEDYVNANRNPLAQEEDVLGNGTVVDKATDEVLNTATALLLAVVVIQANLVKVLTRTSGTGKAFGTGTLELPIGIQIEGTGNILREGIIINPTVEHAETSEKEEV